MAVEKDNIDISEEEKIEEGQGTPIVEDEVDEVSIEGEEEPEVRPQDDFNANLAEFMDERTLSRMGNDLVSEYKKDKTSRKEWEDAYIV